MLKFFHHDINFVLSGILGPSLQSMNLTISKGTKPSIDKGDKNSLVSIGYVKAPPKRLRDVNVETHTSQLTFCLSSVC